MAKMVEERLIEVTLLSASNLKDVTYLSKMEAYAVLSFPPYVDYTTQVDRLRGVNPSWNEKLGFMIPEEVLQRGDGHLAVEIFTLGTLGPKFVSEASIPLTDISLLPRRNEPFLRKYPLKTASGDFHGELSISFALGERVALKLGGDAQPSYPIVTAPGGIALPQPAGPPRQLQLRPLPPAAPSPLPHPAPPPHAATLIQPPRRRAPERLPLPHPQPPAAHAELIRIPSPPPAFPDLPPPPSTAMKPSSDFRPFQQQLQAPRPPATSVVGLPQGANFLFSGPLGKLLLMDLSERRPFGGYV